MPSTTSTTKTSTAVGGRRNTPFGIAGQQRPIHAEGEADAGRGRAAEGLGQAVVAAATTDGVLGRAEADAGVLERGAGVVVESADEPGLELEGHPERRQAGLDPLEGGRRRLGDRKSVIEGAAAMTSASSGRLESRTRSGLRPSVSRLCSERSAR